MIINILRWIAVLALAFIAGKLMTKIKMPSILGWLIVGMLLGPHAVKLMPESVLNAGWYKIIIMWMQCAFGVMLGSELIWSKLKTSGKALIITTLTQSLGTFAIVSLAFGIVFYFANIRCIWHLSLAVLPLRQHRHRLYPLSMNFTQRALSQTLCCL